MSSFFAYDKTKNGLDIALSDLDHDGIAEIVALTTDVFTLTAQ